MREGVPIAEAVEQWLDDLLIAGKSTHTVRNYRAMTRALEQLTPDAARRCIRPYVGSNTARTCWAALRSLSTYCEQRGWGRFMDGVPRPGERERAHRYLSQDEVQHVYQACRDDRERLIIRLLLTGVRADELLQILPDVIQDHAVRVRGKGGRYRLVPLDADTEAMLLAAGAPCRSYRVLHYTVRRIGERAGVKLHPHLFRHTFGSWWMIEVGDGLILQQLGGWANGEMIRERYAKSAMERAALNKARAVNLTAKLLT